MRKSATVSADPYSLHYLRRRTRDLATAKTRASNDPLADWAVRRIRLDGRPFSFEGHEYLRALYDDRARHIVVSKAAQVGGTTWAILRAIHTALTGLNVIYFFPTRTDVLDFVRGRVNPLLQENPRIARRIADADTVGLKRLGDAFLYFRGMQSTVGMKSVPADMVVFDELDEATPEARALALERLGHSDFKRVIELSNPSLPDYGIDEVYGRSDQQHWTLKCPACGTWSAPDREFPTKLGQEVRIIRPRPDGTFYRACPKCEAELDLAAGEWVAEFPGRDIHGYRISQLISSRVDPGEILHEYHTTRYRERFFNLKIGVPWADLERRLTEAAVLDLCGGDEFSEANPDPDYGICYMGVDTGSQLHVVVLWGYPWDERYQTRLIYLAKCSGFAELDAFMERYQIHRCVIDGLPETHATRDFARRHRGQVYLSFFSEHQHGVPVWDFDSMKVTVNRTEALDASRAAIREKLVRLPRQSRLLEEFARHMTADAKTLDEDEKTGARQYRYFKTSGANHFSLAFTYAWLAMDPPPAYRPGIVREEAPPPPPDPHEWDGWMPIAPPWWVG